MTAWLGTKRWRPQVTNRGHRRRRVHRLRRSRPRRTGVTGTQRGGRAGDGAPLATPATPLAGRAARHNLVQRRALGDVQLAVNRSDRWVSERVIAYGRLPLQVPLVAWAGPARSRRSIFARKCDAGCAEFS